MIKSICTHPSLIRNYSNSLLSFYYLLKTNYKNSIIYAWNVNKLSKKTSESFHTCKKLSYHLIEKGLAYEHVNSAGQVHLILPSMFKIGNKKEHYKKGVWSLNIDSNTKLKDISKQLMICSLKENLSRQAYSAKRSHTNIVHKEHGMVKHGDEFSLQHMDITALISRISNTRNDADNSFKCWDSYRERSLNRLIITVRGCARLWGISKSAASKILNELKEEGILRTRRLRFEVGNYHGYIDSPKSLWKGHIYASNKKLIYDMGQEVLGFEYGEQVEREVMREREKKKRIASYLFNRAEEQRFKIGA